jgi:hypothetical protein
MKLNIPPAYQLTVTAREAKKIRVESLVEKFLNIHVCNEILYANKEGNKSTCVKIPGEFYGLDYRMYIDLCVTKLVGLGYSAEDTHDGAGMYNVLYIRWK